MPRFKRVTPALLLAALAACDGSAPTSSDTAVSAPSEQLAGRGGNPGPVAQVTVILNFIPDGPQDVAFTFSTLKKPFLLDDDADPTLLNSRTFPSLRTGSYTIALPSLPPQTRQTNLVCQVTGTGGSTTVVNLQARTATIAINGPDAVTCTFTVEEDRVAPTVTVNQGATQADPTTHPLITFDVEFSESVTEVLTAADLEVGGTAGWQVVGITPDNLNQKFSVVLRATAAGTLTLAIPANAVTDFLGNGNEASTSTDNTVTYDPAPVANMNLDVNGHSVTASVSFSEPVSGFDLDDVLVTFAPTTTQWSANVGSIVSTGPSSFSVSITFTDLSCPSVYQGSATVRIRQNAAFDSASQGNAETSESAPVLLACIT